MFDEYEETMETEETPFPDVDEDEAPRTEQPSGAELQELLELLEMLSRNHPSSSRDEDGDDDDDSDDDDSDEDDSDDEGDDDSDEDDSDDEGDDDSDEYDEDDEDDEEGAPVTQPGHGKSSKVILRSQFKSNNAYCNAVIHAIGRELRNFGVHSMPHQLSENRSFFTFDRSAGGVDTDCRIIIENDMCNCRIEFKINGLESGIKSDRAGRGALLDWFIADKNFALRYGSLVRDHSDSEKKLELSFCFYDAFSVAVFHRYYEALEHTATVYVRPFAALAYGKAMDLEQRKIAARLVGELSSCLSGKVKSENQARFVATCDALGIEPDSKYAKLVNYLIERSK